MSDATQVTSTRDDARAFADAFAAADDAFTFGADAGESRTLTLDELGEAIGLGRPVASPGPRFPAASPVGRRAPAAAPAAPGAAAAGDDELLTLDQLSEALAGPVREDVLDFDFGTRAHERARRRTAARLGGSPSARRRISGPAATSARGRRPDVRQAEDTRVAARPATEVQAPPGSRAAMADAASSAAERLADPAPRFARDDTGASRLDAARVLPASLRPSDAFLADPDARRTVEITGRPGALAAVPRLREVEQRQRAPRAAADRLGANPDRIAMWAVLLGILLVLIAFTSGSAGAVAMPLLSAL